MKSSEIRQKFLDFFEKRGHTILPSASLITPDEKGVTNSTLFNTAGVQPLIPYLLGKDHPKGKRLASCQKCVRTIDIDEVGDNTHLTFFEMLGNWSLGDYFKEEAIEWSYQFLTDKEEGLGLDPNRLYITVFAGNEIAPKDEEAIEIWKKYIPENRIYPLESNWWEAGENGPCGPDTEMFYDITEEGISDLSHGEFVKADDDQKVVEIWNDVFMQFEKKDGKIIGPLPRQAVDTGAGLERITTAINHKTSVYDTDLFEEIISFIKNNSENYEEKSARIIADHIKAAIFIITEGVKPSSTDRGYVLRKLIRRAVYHFDWKIKFQDYQKIINYYTGQNPELNKEEISKTFEEEVKKTREVISIKDIDRALNMNATGETTFVLETSKGIPKEITEERARELGKEIKNPEKYDELLKKHQELSRQGAEKKFKGGLAGTSEMEIKYHTATHLLQQALREVLGNSVSQRGSNITPDRLRFDFSYPEKMTNDQKKQVEDIVNQKITENLPVNVVELPLEEAEKTGALHFFGDKYGDKVTVYYIGNDLDSAYSKEFCGGPHVNSTRELGKFRIKKEEASSAGIRRIKAVLE